MNCKNIKEEEYKLLGISLIQAQQLEFILYGIISHLGHLDEAQKDKRFKNLTPEKFLRGPIEELKATLGQIEKQFGSRLLLSTDELTQLIKNRNLIVHNYWKIRRTSRSNSENLLNNPIKFLTEFISSCDYWDKVLRGLLSSLIKTAAEKEGRSKELILTEQDKNNIEIYKKNAEKHLLKAQKEQSSSH